MRKLAAEVLNECWGYSLPVDPMLVANHYEISVLEHAPISKPTASYAYIESSRRMIQLASTKTLTHERFILSHALGHHLLGHVMPRRGFRDVPQSYSFENRSRFECQANRFAFELLMPLATLKRLMDDQRNSELDVLAKKFDVTIPVLKYRITYLTNKIDAKDSGFPLT